jgi:hypothetical protein
MAARSPRSSGVVVGLVGFYRRTPPEGRRFSSTGYATGAPTASGRQSHGRMPLKRRPATSAICLPFGWIAIGFSPISVVPTSILFGVLPSMGIHQTSCSLPSSCWTVLTVVITARLSGVQRRSRRIWQTACRKPFSLYLDDNHFMRDAAHFKRWPARVFVGVGANESNRDTWDAKAPVRLPRGGRGRTVFSRWAHGNRGVQANRSLQ